MAGEIVSTAYLGLVPTIRGFEKNIGAQLSSSVVTAQADQAGRSIGQRLASSAMGAVKTGLKLGAVIGGVVAGITIKGGLDRALGIENAQAKMKGLGYATKDVDKIMSNALASVEGTAFGLDAAATTAAGAVAAGIKPGQQLEGVLKTVANTAAATGGTMDEVGSIFNTVAAVGSAYTGDINMLAQRGIPIWQSLSKTLGKSQADVRKMATEGKIDFATFEAAAKDAAGGVATAMGDTTQGAFQNMMASVRKLGAMLLTGVLPLAKTTFAGIQGLLNAVKTKMQPIVEGIFDKFGGPAQAGIKGFFDTLIAGVERFDPQPLINFFTTTDTSGGGFFNELKGGILSFAAAWKYNDGEITSSGFPGFMEHVGYLARQLWESLKQLDFSSLQSFVSSLGAMKGTATGALSGIGAGLGEIGKAAPGVLSIAVQGLGNAMDFLGRHSDLVVKLLPVLVAGFIAYRAATAGMTAAVQANTAAYHALLPAMIVNNVARAVATTQERMLLRAQLASKTSTLQEAAAKTVSTGATIRATIAERARTIATKAGTLATNAANLAQRAFGAALRFAMGPIGWIIAGVALLATGLYLFFTKTEAGKQIWASIWGAIKNAAAAVVDWFTGTALPVLQAAWDGIAAGATWLYENAILPAWTGIQTAVAVVGDWITGTLWPAMQAAWQGISVGALWLYENVITPVWYGIRVAIAVAVAIIMTYIDLLTWYWSSVLAPVAMWLWNNVISPAWDGIQAAIGAVVTWVTDTAVPFLQSAWQVIASAATWLYESVILPVWNAIKIAIALVVAAVMTYIDAWVAFFRNVVAPVFTWLWQSVIQPVWNGIQSSISAVVTWFQTVAWPALQSVIAWVSDAFTMLKVSLAIAWAYIHHYVIQPVVSWFQTTVWPIFQMVIGFIQARFETFKNNLSATWGFIRNSIISPVVNWFRDTVGPIFTRVTDGIKSAFDTMKDGVKRAWDSIKSAAMAPIRFVVETVVRDGIVKNFNKIAKPMGVKEIDAGQFTVGFAGGGILPGFSRMRDGDDQLVPMRRGEGVLVSEGLRDQRSRGLFLAANAAARRGVSFADFMGGGYAKGGIVDDLVKGAKDLGGDAIDAVKKGWDFAAEALTNPAGAFKTLVDGLVKGIPGAGVMLDLATAVPRKIASMIGEKLAGAFSAGGSDAAGVPAKGGTGGNLGAAEALAKQFGLVVTSRGRRGARTAQNGVVSLHALGRAIDVAGSPAAMMSFFNAADARFGPTELLYSPAGARNIHRGGRRGPNVGKTLANHYSHVHIGFAKGGIVPSLYDSGGWLDPGLHVVANKTRRPEAVLTGAQTEVLHRLASQDLMQSAPPVQIENVYGHSAEDVAEQIEQKRRRRAALVRV